MRDSVVYSKAFKFAVEVVKLYKRLRDEKAENVLSKQLLRSGTSIGANVREALEAQSKKDFISKLCIALKEAAETEYWIELLIETGYLNKDESDFVLKEVQEIIKVLNAIIKTTKKNIEA